MTMAIKGGRKPPDSFLMWPLLPVVTGPSCWPLWVSTYRAVVSMAHALSVVGVTGSGSMTRAGAALGFATSVVAGMGWIWCAGC